MAKYKHNYFEQWWKPIYKKWMICARGEARDMMDTNNLIKAFHYKLKYMYMRGHLRCRLNSEVYLHDIYKIQPDVWIV
jgi:hypothetical protein